MYTMEKKVNPWNDNRKVRISKTRISSKVWLLILVVLVAASTVLVCNEKESKADIELMHISSQTFHKEYKELDLVYTEQDLYDYEEALIYHVANTKCSLVDIFIDIDSHKDTSGNYRKYIDYVVGLNTYDELKNYELKDIKDEKIESELRLSFIKDLKKYR